jgi:hypothetical protein
MNNVINYRLIWKPGGLKYILSAFKLIFNNIQKQKYFFFQQVMLLNLLCEFIVSLLVYLPYFEKTIKGGLLDHLVLCLCIILFLSVCVFLQNFCYETYEITLLYVCLCVSLSPPYFFLFPLRPYHIRGS